MKKSILSASLLLMTSLALAGCGDTAAPSEEETAASASIEEAAVEEQVAAEDEAAIQDTAQVSAYTDQMADFSTRLADNMAQFGQQNIDLSTDMSLLYDADWMTDTALLLLELEELIGEYRTITPPAEFQPSYDIMSLAMDEYEYIVSDYADAIDEMDPDKLNSVSEHILKGTDYIVEAGTQLEQDAANAGI